MFDERGEAFDPVTVIAVEHSIDHPDLGMVNVAAYHAICAASSGFAGDRGFEVTDVAHRPLHLELEIARQAPVGQSKAGAQRVEMAIDLQGPFVADVAQIREPLGALNHAVEEVAVGDPESLAVGGDVDRFGKDVDAAEVVLEIAPCELVVITGHEDDPCPLACLSQDLLDNVVVGLRPEPGSAELPAINDVAHKIERLALGITQKVQ